MSSYIEILREFLVSPILIPETQDREACCAIPYASIDYEFCDDTLRTNFLTCTPEPIDTHTLLKALKSAYYLLQPVIHSTDFIDKVDAKHDLDANIIRSLTRYCSELDQDLKCLAIRISDNPKECALIVEEYTARYKGITKALDYASNNSSPSTSVGEFVFAGFPNLMRSGNATEGYIRLNGFKILVSYVNKELSLTADVTDNEKTIHDLQAHFYTFFIITQVLGEMMGYKPRKLHVSTGYRLLYEEDVALVKEIVERFDNINANK